MASYNQDWPFNIGVTPVGQQTQTQSVLNLPLKQDLHSPSYHRGVEFSPSPNSTMFTYDLNCNNNSNDWLNAGCSKYMRHEAMAFDASPHSWTQNPLYVQQATVIEAAWAYASHNY